MTLFSKIKFMPFSNLPSTTPSNEVFAVPFSIANGNAPDYSNAVQLYTGTTFTVGAGVLANYSRGYLIAGCTARSDDSSPGINFNGYSAILMGFDGDYGGDLSGYYIFIPAKTGDYFYIDGSQGYPVVYFVPTKE